MKARSNSVGGSVTGPSSHVGRVTPVRAALLRRYCELMSEALNVARSSSGEGPEPPAESSPNADQLVDELITGLEQAAAGESDPEISARLRGAAAILGTIGRHVTTEVTAKIIVRAMDL